MSNQFMIFSDGASKGNPGPGGFGAVIVSAEKVLEIGGAEKETTNNRMELTAALSALEKTPLESEIEVYTDSRYVINGITKWVSGWQKNNWQTKAKEPVLNQDLWQKLVSATAHKNISWHYVGGHIGVAGNERCDEIASSFASGEKVELYSGSFSDYKIDVTNLGHQTEKKEKKSKSNAPAYSYLSLVNGVLNKDKTWAECEKRVKGVKGAKFKKSISAEDEIEILKEWGV